MPETVKLPNNIKMKCETLDDKRKVCALDGETFVLKKSDINNYQMEPQLAERNGIIVDGEGYEEYYKSYLKERGDTEKLSKIKELENKLEPYAEEMESKKNQSEQNVEVQALRAQVLELNERVNELEEKIE